MEQLHTAQNLNITDYAKDLSIILSRGEGTMCIFENRIISRSKDFNIFLPHKHIFYSYSLALGHSLREEKKNGNYQLFGKILPIFLMLQSSSLFVKITDFLKKILTP